MSIGEFPSRHKLLQTYRKPADLRETECRRRQNSRLSTIRCTGVTELGTQEEPALVKGLGGVEATTLIVGGIIGTTVFLITSDVAEIVGSPVLVLVAWLLAGLLQGMASLCFAELAASMPQSGGTYVFIKRAFRSDMLAFSYGWMMCFAYAAGAIAVVAILAATYLMQVLQAFGIVDGDYIKTGAVSIIVILTFLNSRGIRQGGIAQNVITAMKILLVVGLISAALLLGSPDPARLTDLPVVAPGHSPVRDISAALMLVLFSYSGTFFVTHVAEEIRQPERNIPRAIVIGFSIVLVLYMLLNTVYVTAMSFDDVRASERIASDLMEMLVGPGGATLTAFIIFVSSVGVLNAQLLNYPRIPFALSRDGVFFGWASRINPRSNVPSGAIILIGTVASLYALTGSYGLILSYVAFVVHFFICLAVIAVVLMRIREPDLPRPFKVWGYPFTPVIFLAVSAVYLFNLLSTQTANVLVGVVIVLAGIPYFLYRRREQSADIQGDGS